MKHVNFDSLDLNLLRVFDVLLEHNNVTRAGEKLGLSQSAVSRALGKLRYVFDDQLFVRSAGLMVPTPLAVQIGAKIHNHLLQLRGAVTVSEFDPADSSRCFNIACGDFTCTTFMPSILNTLKEEAPRVQLRMLPYSPDNVRDLDEAKVDVIVGNFRNIPERFAFDVLAEDPIIGVMRRGNPMHAIIREGAPLPDLAYVVIDTMAHRTTFGADPFQTLRGLEQMATSNYDGRSLFRSSVDDRTLVRAIVPAQLAGVALIASTDYVMILPERMFQALKDRFDLVSFPIPAQPGLLIGLLWHHMHAHDPAHAWLRGLFARAAGAGSI